MRILHFVHSLDARTGGPSRTVPRLALAQAALGHQVEIAALEGDGPQMSAEARDLAGGGVRTTFSSSIASMRGEFRELLRTADVVNVHGIWNPANHAACALAFRARVPVVISTRGMLEPWALQNHAVKKRIGWWIYQRRDLERSAALHATSEQERDNLLRLGLKTRVTVVPNGVDAPPPLARTDALPPRSILFLSRVDKKKGIPLLIDAAAANARVMREYGWRILVVGPSDPSHASEVRRRVEEKAVGDLFEFRDAVDGIQKWSLLRSAELLVLPTYSENFGLVIAEALASGTPVLTTTGTPWSDLRSIHCGWWVPAESSAISTALREALSLSTAERRAMGSRGVALVREKYDWARIAEAMTELYRTAVRGA